MNLIYLRIDTSIELLLFIPSTVQSIMFAHGVHKPRFELSSQHLSLLLYLLHLLLPLNFTKYNTLSCGIN